MNTSRCPECSHGDLEVQHRQHNHSAFNGYRYTPSDYSEVRCKTCDWRWRTRAKYVSRLLDVQPEE
jgi:hypothetical protein